MVTVTHVFIAVPFQIKKEKGLYEFQKDSFPIVDFIHNGTPYRMSAGFYKGFKSDGASSPFPFSLIVPKYREGHDIYNLGHFLHDALYALKGDGLFSREECDDFLRGIWRESGMGRFVAGVSDKCIEWFAGNKKHWGNDENDIKKYFNFHCRVMR